MGLVKRAGSFTAVDEYLEPCTNQESEAMDAQKPANQQRPRKYCGFRERKNP